jgi:hypothetical protein
VFVYTIQVEEEFEENVQGCSGLETSDLNIARIGKQSLKQVVLKKAKFTVVKWMEGKAQKPGLEKNIPS